MLTTNTATAASESSVTITELSSLLTPGVMLLVVFTGAVGMWLAPIQAHPFIQLLVIAMIALGSVSGGMMNMWYDRDIDAIMTRTRKRPIPAGLVQADDVLVCGIMLAIASVAILGLATNWFAAGLLAFAIAFYAMVYTVWLKRSTSQNIVIGGAAGAFPPVIGWAAMTGSAPLEVWVMFAIVFLWTPPHFWALALYRNDDYRKANIPMLPVVKGLDHTKWQMEIYCWLLLAFALLPVYFGTASAGYALAALALNARFILHARTVRRSHDEVPAKRMFGFSILYLFALFSALLIDGLLHPFYAGIF